MNERETLANKIAELEREISDGENDLRKEYPEVFRLIDKLEETKEEVRRLKDELKAKLVEDDDFDMYQSGNMKYSVSKVAKLVVDDIEKVPKEFKVIKEVADEKKAQDFYKLMGTAPEGFTDKSYYRLNWKEM